MAATHLQKITARAKQIRKAHPKMIWTDAIKKASKELAGKKVGAVKKKAAPKKAAMKKPHTKWGKVASHKRRVAGSEKHTDTKSHNVNIRVVSGSKSVSINQKRNEIEKDLMHYKQGIEKVKRDLQFMSAPEKKRAREAIKSFNEIVKNLKTQLKIHNTLIAKSV